MNRARLRRDWALIVAVAAAVGAFAAACESSAGWQSQEQPLCPGPTTLQGLDVYEGDGVIDWGQVADAGISFAIVKATEGLTFQDTEFPTNWAALKANGLARGAYHFFHPADDGTAQADYYLSYVGPIGFPGDIPPVLDWEVTDCVPDATIMQEAQKFIDEIQARTGLTTIIYTSNRVWTGINGGSQFANSPLWVASRGVTCPVLPSGWTDFVFWQYTFTGSVPGVPSSPNVDLDLFNGTAAQLGTLNTLGQDAGQSLDGSLPSDASVTADASTTLDAGVDAGVDAGSTAGSSDASSTSDSGEAMQNAGCGCSQPPGLPVLASLIVTFGGLTGIRRRRSRS